MNDNTKPVENNNEQRQKQSVVIATTGVVLLLVVLFVIAFVAGWLGSRAAQNGSIDTTAGSSVDAMNDGNSRVTTQEAGIAAVVDKVGKSVVSITSQTADYSRGQLFEGAGTGMIISKDGYVMTNKHVVGNSKTVVVAAENGVIYDKVPVVGVDKLNDIAFLKIPNVNDLTPVVLGNSTTLRVGQGVIAIGNALGQYQNTVTSGIISGKGRPVTAASSTGGATESLTDLLQTDAAINNGNSGGPLLNLEGQVVGINTAVAADAQNIGFAIPISSAKGMIKELIATGQVRRAYLGVRYISITPDVKAQYRLSESKGDLIVADGGRAIVKGGPAEAAGLKDRDIIVQVDDQEVAESNSIATIIGQYRPGETVKLTIVRDGNRQVKNVTLGTH